MLAKKTRISKQKDFDYIFKNGSVYRGKFIAVKATPNINDLSRFAIIVSKKISTRATVRNLAKRRIRNIVAKLYPRLINGVNLIIILRQFNKNMLFADLYRDLEETLIGAKIIKKNV